MSKKNPMNRLLSLLLAVAMVLSLTVPVMAEETDAIGFEKVDNSKVNVQLTARQEAQNQQEEAPYGADDVVRVSIVLESKGTIEAGFASAGIADNASAMNYRDTLKAEQAELTVSIQNVLGEELDVVWNLTLAANMISANVKYGQIAAIEAVPGVVAVVLETQYEPCTTEDGDVASPNMAVSGGQVGAYNAWAAGYTGAGSKVAIIDTGLDLLHEAFAADAFEYSLSLLDGEYDLLTLEGIDAVLAELNVLSWRPGTTAEELYANSKAPFAFSYIDKDLDVSHYNSEHGSHVAGISAANAYVERDGEFVKSLETTGVQGIAPDAQILVMQVFGDGGGAYDSDYMAAIEDAIILGADSVNLSLGSAAPGMSRSATYQSVMESLVGCGVTVVMSAGNNGHWYDESQNGVPYLYLDDVGTHTGGSPGSFTNSFGVASVDNDGEVTLVFTVGEHTIAVTESLYSNEPLATLAGEQEFVLIEGLGKPEDWAALGDAVKGKVAFCYRGETSFYQKAEAAVEAGAIAVVVCNNQDGVIRMDLSDYSYTAPVVSITQADAELIKAAATKEGGYYTGTMTINPGPTGVQYNSDYYTMSSFSSWGVPGSLTMKPEIAAPGGNIYSVAGYNPADTNGVTGHDKYELMSGTSMAAPQVAGMVAVLAQYIRETGLDAQTGLDSRVLAHSLLMSTAVPMYDETSGYYYPILQQGAGQANIGQAVASASYILMGSDATASYADGKVKAELGEDPDRNGVYTFSFTLNNLTAEQQVYQLNADVFTQGAGVIQGNLYMDRATMPLNASTTWKVNGQALKPFERHELDFNGDEVVNEADGQMILDYVSGKITELSNLDAADVNGDGKVTSYDAHLFFIMTEGGNNIVLPANGTVDVEVTIALAEDEKSFLDAYYTGGAYIQAYVYANAVADEEGAVCASHSIPVLGFYGSWTDASMFDKGSVMEYSYGEETRVPYMYSSNLRNDKANTLYLKSGSSTYFFGGNPVVADETYMPERNALSVVNGDYITSVGYSLIRNAGTVATFVKNTETGEYLLLKSQGQGSSAYYKQSSGAWTGAWTTKTLNYKGTGVADDTALEIGVAAIPEYYTLTGASLAELMDMVGEGATFSMPVVIDNTAPEATWISLSMDKKTLGITAEDNQYVAGVLLIDATGTVVEAYTGANADVEAGESSVFYLDVSQALGEKFYIQVIDYADNATTYELDMRLGELVDEVSSVSIEPASVKVNKGKTVTVTATVMPKNASDRTVTWTSSDESVATVDAAGVITGVEEGTATITATSNLDPTKSASCEVVVAPAGTTLHGILADAEGYTYTYEWLMDGQSDWTGTQWASEHWFLSGTQVPGTDTAFAIDFLDGGIYKINTADNSATAVGAAQVPMGDMDYSGVFSTETQPKVNAVYGAYFFPAQDATEYDLYGFNMTNYLSAYTGASTFLAVATAGPTTASGKSAEKVLLLDDAGYIWSFSVYESDTGYGAAMGYARTDLANKGCELAYAKDADGNILTFSSMHVAEDGSIYLAALTTEGANSLSWYNKIYKLTASGTRYVATYVGSFENGTYPAIIAEIEGSFSGTNAVLPEFDEVDINVEATAITVEELMNVDLTGAVVFETENAANGGLNAITVPATDIIIPLPHSDEVEVVVVPVNDEEEEIATTNGKFTVTYDNTQLTLETVKVFGAQYYSVNDNGDGTVTVAYVGPEEMEAGSVVAKLLFAKDATKDTEIAIAHQEYNDAEYELVQTAEIIRNKISLEDLIELIKEYYDEAYAYAYDYAETNGYIAELVAAIDEQIAALKALNLDDVQMTDEFRTELEVEIEKIIETLEAAKALVLEADELDQPTLDALLALLDEAADALVHVEHLLVQAGKDVNELYILPNLPELKAKLAEAVKAGTEYLLEKAGIAYEVLVAHIKDKAPEAADWVYTWLYNNPETVIAFFNEYGDEMVAFLDAHGESIAAVLACLLATYGEDITAYVLANADEILVTIVKWFEIHGENTWALVKVYLDALGITDAFNAEFNDVLSTVIAEVARIKAELEAAVNELKAMAETLKAQIEAAIGEEKVTLEALLAEVEAAIARMEEILAKLNAALDNLSAAIAQLEAAVAKLIAEGFNAAAEDVQLALDAVATAIEEVVAVASEEVAAGLDSVVETLKVLLNDRYLNATNGNYELTPASYLVALGDGTATGSSYVEKLAAELGELRGYTYNYNNLAEEGLMIQDVYSVILDNAEEIAKADLVTLGFGNNGFTNFAADYLMAMMNGEAIELDWTVFVGEEGLPYVEELKTKLAAELAAAGINGQYNNIEFADLLVAAVEAYAYSYVAYTSNLPEVVNTIHAVNPDAQVVVVGMYNPLQNVVLNVEGTKVDIGNYMRFMVDAANVTALTYGMVTGDIIYVDAPAVETLNSRTEMSVAYLITEIVINKCGKLNPSNAGHAYIAEQIMNALNVTVSGLLGDADNNGVVNTLDAMMVLQYYTGIVSEEEINLGVSDLDGNGVVNTLDATLILHFYTGIIEKFPVEN